MEVREAALDYGQQKLTIEEYLGMENAAVEKHEYYRGEVRLMPLLNIRHNMISANLLVALGQKLKGKECKPNFSKPHSYPFKHLVHLS